MTTRWQLLAANYKEIQAEVMRLCNKMIGENNMTRARAIIKAVDQVAALSIDPPTSGVHLDKWLATMRSGRAYEVIQEIDAKKPPEGLMPQLTFGPDVDDFGASGSDMINVVINQMTLALRQVKPGDVVSFKCANTTEALFLKRQMQSVIKKLGWHGTRSQPAYRAKALPDRLKIKRLL